MGHPMSDSSDSDGDDDDPTQHPVVVAGGEPTQLLASLIGGTTVANGVTWTTIDNVTDSTVAERVEKLGNPGLRNGLPVKDDDVYLFGLWMMLNPGDVQRDIDNMNVAGLIKRLHDAILQLGNTLYFGASDCWQSIPPARQELMGSSTAEGCEGPTLV